MVRINQLPIYFTCFIFADSVGGFKPLFIPTGNVGDILSLHMSQVMTTQGVYGESLDKTICLNKVNSEFGNILFSIHLTVKCGII